MRVHTPKQYLLSRVCPKTGYRQTVVYTGALRAKPAGWRLEGVL
jgi:hypothetical protein